MFKPYSVVSVICSRWRDTEAATLCYLQHDMKFKRVNSEVFGVDDAAQLTAENGNENAQATAAVSEILYAEEEGDDNDEKDQLVSRKTVVPVKYEKDGAFIYLFSFWKKRNGESRDEGELV